MGMYRTKKAPLHLPDHSTWPALILSTGKGSAFMGCAPEPQPYATHLTRATENGRLKKFGGNPELWTGGQRGDSACMF